MNAHVSAILLGVKDMEHAKRFYTELGWKVQHDYKISVFSFPTAGRWSASTAATGSPTWWA